jgi:heme o synthase
MFALIFMWTPPHFWALALFMRSDYDDAGVPMLTVTHGRRATRAHVLGYTLVLVPVALASRSPHRRPGLRWRWRWG